MSGWANHTKPTQGHPTATMSRSGAAMSTPHRTGRGLSRFCESAPRGRVALPPPLVLASAEPWFDPERDAWFDLDLEGDPPRAPAPAHVYAAGHRGIVADERGFRTGDGEGRYPGSDESRNMKRKPPILRFLARFVRRILPKSEWGDKVYAWGTYVWSHRRFPRKTNPSLFSDRLYKLKTDGSIMDPLRQLTTDKEYVKHYVSYILGREYVAETYRVLRCEADIANFTPPPLPRIPYVVKPTHLSGEVIFCTEIDACPDRALMRTWFDLNHYDLVRERNYRYLIPKIIVEEFLSKDGKTPPSDYKFFCFDGIPKFIQVDSDRYRRHTRDLYDVSWNRVPAKLRYPTTPDGDIPRASPRPAALEEMLDIATRLSRAFSFVRVDMYVTAGGVKVGELTHCPEGANGRISPFSAETVLGRLFESSCSLDVREPAKMA